MKPNTVKSALRFALGALSLGILTACGGGDAGDPAVADGGIRGTGSSVGPVSGFGSVFVNGIKFETVGAQFLIDDNAVNQDEDSLRKGMILRIEGEWREDGTGQAEVVEYDDTFRGQVANFSGLDLEGAGDFEILGQTITISPQTVIRLDTGVTDLQDGDFVRVSAWRDGLGYRASLIEVVDATAEVEIEGPVDAGSVDLVNKVFAINGQLVRYDLIALRDGLIEPELSGDGLIVEVEGSVRQLSGDISANEVRLADDRRFQGTNGEDIEITGPVNDFTAGGDSFSINGIPVDILDDTLFDDLARADIFDGLLVEVEGDVEQGRVQAREISLREGNAEVKGPITPASQSRAAQTFEIGGVLVQLIAQTLITDETGAASNRDFDDLNDNLDVEVEGIELTNDAGDAFIQALKIEVEPEFGPVEYEVEGKLQSVSQTGTLIGTTIRVLDVTIDLTADTEFENDGLTFQQLEAHVGELIEVEYECADLLGQGCTAVSIDLD